MTVTTATAINGVMVITQSMNVARENTTKRLRETTRALAARINADDLATLREPSQHVDPIYLRTHAQMKRTLDHVEGVGFIYTLRKVEGTPRDEFSRYAFVVDGTPYASEDYEPIGSVMTTSPSTDALHRVWQTGQFEADRGFVTDEWGTWLSGYYPLFRRDGSFEAVLGIDINSDHVIAERQRILSTLSQGYLLSLLIILPTAAFFGRRISSPLRRINGRLLAVSTLDFDPERKPEPITGRWVHEIHEISDSMERVESALVDFSRYVPAKLVRKLVLNADQIQLGGEVRQLAILFTDIIGFTEITESLDPETILDALNEYFSVIHDTAESTQGVLDKYMGDSALLFWGAPDSIEDPARCAVETALSCHQRLEDLNRRWQQEGRPLCFHTSFGLDYGAVVVGNMGSTNRVNYTIVGDRVNLCSRVETVNRRYGTRILATRSLITALGEDRERYVIVKIDDAHLRGIHKPVELFEIRGRRTELDAEEVAFAASFDSARSAAQAGHHGEAIQRIDALPERFRHLPYVRQALRLWRQGDGHHGPPEPLPGLPSRRDVDP
ncbi:adenylate/guanylate cyclase domain-containing protein [Cyanobium sp. ATX 6A2]|uniref:adenylate/guanylate cyclase domain-containing protein n=1 Tax=Cyanobium sp. ATX 6A2 TaxID=2823700 RepID=UPI0020CFE1B2|nr:adenylate/guanylate cyclase domain-containing protein [Cyanobium sp. ATX 6A2]MCP9887333.1 adenylate/guanylate cyclase domain-containing protein [Cyanobium sp. ATX 6A2]